MSREHTHPFEETAWVYALGALDGDDLIAFRAHLASGCHLCGRAIAQGEAVAGQLPLAIEPRPLPADDRERIRERLLAQTPIARMGPPPIRTPRAPRTARSRTFLSRALATMAAAAIVVLAIRVSTITRARDAARQRIVEVESHVAALQGMIAGQVSELSDLRRKLAEQVRRVAFLEDPATRTVDLRGKPPAEGARGRIFWTEVEGTGRLVAQGLPRLEAGKIYALWVMDTRGLPSASPAGLFRADTSGRGTLTVAPPKDFGRVQVFAVTIEPEAGVPKPTGPIALIGYLDA